LSKDAGIVNLILFYKIALTYEQKRVGPIPEDFSEKNMKERMEYQFKKEAKDIMETGLSLDGRTHIS